MFEDDVFEVSDSLYINPITVFHKIHKKPKLCIDMHHVNSLMIPDHERTAPLHDYPNLEAVEVAFHSHMSELWICWMFGHQLLYWVFECDNSTVAVLKHSGRNLYNIQTHFLSSYNSAASQHLWPGYKINAVLITTTASVLVINL